MIASPTPQERKALQSRYAPQRTIVKWQVISCGKVVFENESPAICEWWIKNSGIKALKKAVYK
jgi:hypothetical protein